METAEYHLDPVQTWKSLSAKVKSESQDNQLFPDLCMLTDL